MQDPSIALGDHRRQDGPRSQEAAIDIDIEDETEVVEGDLVGLDSRASRHPGAIDENVDAVQIGEDLLDRCGDVRFLRHIGAVGAGRGANGRAGGFEGRLVQVEKGNARSLCRQLARNRQPQPCRRSRNDRDLSGKLSCHLFLPFLSYDLFFAK